MNTKAIGDVSESQVMAALLKAGKVVLIPFGDNQRYDLAIEENGTFQRVQVKTGRLRDGAVVFKACSTYAHRGGKSSNYLFQAELFGVYCPETEKVYLVPVGEIGNSMGSLRVKPSRNGQAKGVRSAADYQL